MQRPRAQVPPAKLQQCADGVCVAFMARVVVTTPGQRIRSGGMADVVRKRLNCGGW